MQRIGRMVYFSIGSLLTVIIAFTVGTLLASNSDINSQQTQQPPVIIIPTLTPDAAQARSGTYQDADLSAFNIVYLANDEVRDGLLSWESLFGAFASNRQVTEMADVKAIAENQAIDALVIQASSEVDAAWIAHLARQGTTIAVIDVSLPVYADWLDSDCIRQLASNPNQRALEAQDSHFVYLQTVTVAAEYAEDISKVIDYALNAECMENSNERPNPVGTYFSGSDFSITTIAMEGDVSAFQQALLYQLKSREELAYNFANRHNPTPLPQITSPGS